MKLSRTFFGAAEIVGTPQSVVDRYKKMAGLTKK